jgi:hypothetical protein
MANTLNSSELKSITDTFALNQNQGISLLNYPLNPNAALHRKDLRVPGAAWAVNNASFGFLNAAGPDGTASAASTLTAAAGAGLHYAICSTTASGNASNVQLTCAGNQTGALAFSTVTVAKAGTASWIFLGPDTNGLTGCYFNLSTGQLGTATSGVVASISYAGNGFFLCTCTENGVMSAITTAYNAALGNFTIISNADGGASFTAAGTETIIIYAGYNHYLPTKSVVNSSELMSINRAAALFYRQFI